MDWILLVSLLLTGLLLIVVEILFVPGTTIVGLFGFAFAISAIFGAYKYFGATAGNYFLVGSLITFTVVIYLSFKSEVWLRFANKDKIEARVNDGLLSSLIEGMEGTTLSELRPIGKAEFSNKVYEVTANHHVGAGKHVRITKVKDSRIFVEPLTV